MRITNTYGVKDSASRCSPCCSASIWALSLALRFFASLEMAASLSPCSTLLGSLTYSFSTGVTLVSLFFPSIYLRVSLDKLQGNFGKILCRLRGNLNFLGRWWCAHLVVSLPFGRGKSFMKISFHAIRTLRRLQTHQKPLPEVGVLVVLGLRLAALTTHLFRNAQGPTSGAPDLPELRVSYRRWRTAEPW